MTDVVWIELTRTQGETRQSFMFGPTGIVSFAPTAHKDTTLLFSYDDKEPVTVLESASDIMSILAKVRGTVGVLTRKNKKTKGKRK
jgi:hypothetical protein